MTLRPPILPTLNSITGPGEDQAAIPEEVWTLEEATGGKWGIHCTENKKTLTHALASPLTACLRITSPVCPSVKPGDGMCTSE